MTLLDTIIVFGAVLILALSTIALATAMHKQEEELEWIQERLSWSIDYTVDIENRVDRLDQIIQKTGRNEEEHERA